MFVSLSVQYKQLHTNLYHLYISVCVSASVSGSVNISLFFGAEVFSECNCFYPLWYLKKYINQATFSTIFIFSLKHLGSGPSHYTQALAQLTASLPSSSVSFCKIHLNVHSCRNGVGFRIQIVSIRFGTSKSVCFPQFQSTKSSEPPKKKAKVSKKTKTGIIALLI